MKITYSITEALTILTERAKALNCMQDLSVEVVYPQNPIGAQDTNTTHQHPLEAYADVVREYGSSRFDVNANKIAAIKSIRNRIRGLGLADAKCVIESDSALVLVYFSRTNTLNGISNR